MIFWLFRGHKHLGVHVVNGFQSKVSHTSAVAIKANQVLGIIRKSLTSLNRHILPLIYKSLVRLVHWEYANAVCMGPYLCYRYKHPIESVQLKESYSYTRYIQDISNLYLIMTDLLWIFLLFPIIDRYREDMIMT